MKMKRYKITYYLQPDAGKIEMVIFAKSYEDACIFAKDYREESFSVEKVEEA